MHEAINNGSPDVELSINVLMGQYLEKNEEATRALDQNPDEKAEGTIKRAENIFLNRDGSHPDIRQRCEEATRVLNEIGEEKRIN